MRFIRPSVSLFNLFSFMMSRWFRIFEFRAMKVPQFTTRLSEAIYFIFSLDCKASFEQFQSSRKATFRTAAFSQLRNLLIFLFAFFPVCKKRAHPLLGRRPSWIHSVCFLRFFFCIISFLGRNRLLTLESRMMMRGGRSARFYWLAGIFRVGPHGRFTDCKPAEQRFTVGRDQFLLSRNAPRSGQPVEASGGL